MMHIMIPFSLKELSLKPDLRPPLEISEDIQQTLAAIVGWDGEGRKLLKSTLSGALTEVSPPVKKVIHKTASEANDVITFSDTPTTEVLVRGHPDNADKVWVTVRETPTVNNSWPLGKDDAVVVTTNNLSELQLLIVGNGEKAIIMYTE
jgi:hypothetical protein